MIDAHCHLGGPEFTGDLTDVVGRAQASGLEHAMVILAAEDTQELARAPFVHDAWPAVRFAIGIHPQAVNQFASDPAAGAQLVEKAIAREHFTRGLGEIGLDYHYDTAIPEVQHALFREQIRLARRLELPIVIHTRDAEDDTFRILAEESAGDVGGMFHCFTGDQTVARRVLDAGFYISLSGIVTFPKALELRDVARMVPLDRLLIETDSPFLAPTPHRGKRNEPSFVTRVAEEIAMLRGVAPEEIGQAAVRNFTRLFKP